ncbi:MAG: hypothetical protein Tsb002_21260 [Wenzhouxiangellaceae bacterium]
MKTRLTQTDYLRFPLRVGAGGGAVSARREHVREQIEQVLFTTPGERWFRPEFGIGVRALVFEPNNRALWEVTRKRLQSTLTEVLAGEVVPSSLEIDVSGDQEQLLVTIAYTLATINHSEKIQFAVEGE